ncbi:MAG: hypothetical protein V7776_23865, partial [Halopseudomonas aestusnigri]
MITPLSLVVRTLFVLGFLVVGPIIYFFEFNKSLWIFFLVSVFIFIGLFFSENKIYNKLSNLNSTPAFMIFVLLFFVVIVLGV